MKSKLTFLRFYKRNVAGLILFYQCKIQLLLLQIGACHFDGDGVSQAVYPVFAASAQAVVLFVEFVIVIVEVADRNHAFALVLIQLHVESPFRYAGDDAVEGLSQAFGHEFYLLVLDLSLIHI